MRVPCVLAHYIIREPHITGYAVLPLPLWETLRFSSFEWGISYRCPGLLYTGLSSCQSTSLHMGKGMKSDFEMALRFHHILRGSLLFALQLHQVELCLASVVTIWPEATLTSMSASHRNSHPTCNHWTKPTDAAQPLNRAVQHKHSK